MGTSAATVNQLLAGLPVQEWNEINNRLVSVPLTLRQVLYEPDHPMTDLYFVEDGLISLIVNMINDEKNAVEVGIIGHEGMIGPTALLFGDPINAYEVLVQIQGRATRLNAEYARSIIERCPVFRLRCYRYIDVMLKQTAQIAGCHLRHTVTERLSRWLLMTHDRVVEGTLSLTQEFLATMLGVRRPGVSLAMSTLQSAGLIRQMRGRIEIVDRQGLETTACPCYRMIRAFYENDPRIL